MPASAAVTDIDAALEIARAVAGEAARLVAAVGDSVGEVRSKGNACDLVTEWDTRSEDLIRDRLSILTPGLPLLSEEAEAARSTSAAVAAVPVPVPDYRWVADPIDGTVNFAHGIPYYTVALSLEHRGQPVVGVVNAPALGWEFYAGLGRGSFMDGRRLAVSAVDNLGQAMLATGFPCDRATSPDNNFAEWEQFQRRAGACRRFGSASLDLCMVARGWLDGYWERGLHPWDLSAGALIVSEAGGKVTSTEGGEFLSASGDAVASNGAIHKQILDELAVVARAPRRVR
jgi:myo-inositol-1(or 4)-monophosphatase